MSETININNFHGERFFDTDGNEWIKVPKGADTKIVCNFNYLDDEAIFKKKILAAEGDPDAAIYVAEEYIEQNGNFKEGYIWLLIAAKNGSETAVKLLKDGKKLLYSHIDEEIDQRNVFKDKH